MNTSQKFICLTILALTTSILSSCSTSNGDKTEGKRWYMLHNCSACHGENGNDGDALSISPPDMNFYFFKKRLRKKDGQIMPYFSQEKLSNDDAADIYVFLKNTK